MNSVTRRAIDTLPKLWVYVAEHLWVLARWNVVSFPKSDNNELLQEAYALLLEWDLPGVPTTPYPELSQQQAADTLMRIANDLKRIDAARCEGNKDSGDRGRATAGKQSGEGSSAPPEQMSPQARAAALLVEFAQRGKKVTKTQLADMVGCHRATLYRDATVKSAWAGYKQCQADRLPSGYRTDSGRRRGRNYRGQ